MKPLTEYHNHELLVVQPSNMKRDYELRANNTVIMKAHFPKWHSSDAFIEGFNAKWNFKRPSIWKSTIEVSKDGFNYPVATYTGKAFSYGGVIQLQRGVRLRIEGKLLKGIYTVFTDTNEMLMEIKQTGTFKKRTELFFGDRKTGLLDEYPWLPMLFWYIILHSQKNISAGVPYS